MLRIIRGQPDIVELHQNDLFELRKDLKQKDDNIGICKHVMRAVKEYDVSCLEFVELSEVRILKARSNYLIADAIDFGTRLRIKRRNLRPELLVTYRPSGKH